MDRTRHHRRPTGHSRPRRRVARRLVTAVVGPTAAPAGLEVLAAKSHMQAGRRTKLTEAADAFDDERARQLRETALRLEQAQRDLEGKRAQLEELLPRLELEKSVFDQKVAEANRALQV